MMDLLWRILWVAGHALAAAIVATACAIAAETASGDNGITVGFTFILSWPFFFAAAFGLSFLIW